MIFELLFISLVGDIPAGAKVPVYQGGAVSLVSLGALNGTQSILVPCSSSFNVPTEICLKEGASLQRRASELAPQIRYYVLKFYVGEELWSLELSDRSKVYEAGPNGGMRLVEDLPKRFASEPPLVLVGARDLKTTSFVINSIEDVAVAAGYDARGIVSPLVNF